MAENEKYVLKHEFESAKGKIHERINDVDNKHTNNFHDLVRRLDRQNSTQENMLKSQQRSEGILEAIKKGLESLGDRVLDIEYRMKNNEEGLTSVRAKIEAEKKAEADSSATLIYLSYLTVNLEIACGL